MLRDTTRRGLCVRVGPHHWHTNERPRRGGPRAGGASGSRSRGPGAGRSLVFGGFAFLPFSLGPAGDCPCRH